VIIEPGTLNLERRTNPMDESPLSLVHRSIITCERCPRLRSYCTRIGEIKKAAHRNDVYWARPVPGFGDPAARLVVVGLAPAAHGANRTGRVFTGDGVGSSGDFLMQAMHAAGFANIPTSRHPDDGLVLRDAFIAAAVRCAPPDNKPLPSEEAACRPHLEAEIRALPRARVLLCLGKIAFDTVWRMLDDWGAGVRPRPAFAHGASHQAGHGWSVIATYHPSRQNTNTGRLTPPMLESVFVDARRLLDGPGRR
jgi:uracil-DNA glycosylase family 4